VIGHLNASREEGPMTRHVASLGMAVAPEWRGRGVGAALMQEVIRWAKEVGVEKLALSVYPHNEAAMALYRKFGFKEEGRLTGHSKKSIGYLDEIVMGLWVNSREPRESE
jgi:L-phenylalanine/L-methionine N-acetyltransferase